MSTILKPDDVLKKGDVVHFLNGDYFILDGKDGCGKKVGDMVADSVERPDPVMSDAERVRILREALEMAKNGLEWWKQEYPLAVQECDYDAMKEIDAALEQTK